MDKKKIALIAKKWRGIAGNSAEDLYLLLSSHPQYEVFAFVDESEKVKNQFINEYEKRLENDLKNLKHIKVPKRTKQAITFYESFDCVFVFDCLSFSHSYFPCQVVYCLDQDLSLETDLDFAMQAKILREELSLINQNVRFNSVFLDNALEASIYRKAMNPFDTILDSLCVRLCDKETIESHVINQCSSKKRIGIIGGIEESSQSLIIKKIQEGQDIYHFPDFKEVQERRFFAFAKEMFVHTEKLYDKDGLKENLRLLSLMSSEKFIFQGKDSLIKNTLQDYALRCRKKNAKPIVDVNYYITQVSKRERASRASFLHQESAGS